MKRWTITLSFTSGPLTCAALEKLIGRFFKDCGMGYTCQHQEEKP